MSPLLREAAEQWLSEQVVRSLASIRPTWFGGDSPPLFPSPRGYLSADHRQRLSGVRAALQHVLGRLAERERIGTELLSPETPFVLNALAEGRRDPRLPSFPGMIRPLDTRWTVRDHPYHHPPASWCRDLLAAMFEGFEQYDEHPVVGGCWLMFFFLAIHPFVDGNGRTSRLLYLLVTSPGLDSSVDLGIAEQWVFHRHRYHEALYRGQHQAPGFDVDRLDPQPFTDATLGWSTSGARLTRERLTAMARVWEACRGLEDGARAAVLLTGLEGMVSPQHLPPALGEYPERLGVLLDLAEAGVIKRVVASPSQRTPGEPPRPRFSLTDETAQRLGRAVSSVRTSDQA